MVLLLDIFTFSKNLILLNLMSKMSHICHAYVVILCDHEFGTQMDVIPWNFLFNHFGNPEMISHLSPHAKDLLVSHFKVHFDPNLPIIGL